MRKALIAAAAAVAFAPALLLAASGEEAHANPWCDANVSAGYPRQACEQECLRNPPVPAYCGGATQAPVQTPQAPPKPPSTVPVQTPQVKPPTTVKPIALPTPKDVSAPDTAVAAARNAPATTIDPRNPPVATQPVDVTAAVQQNSKQAAAPQHWGFVDYNNDRHPVLYNPVGVDMTFRYFYDGDYRDVYVPAGGRVVLTTAIAGMFPFTAVGVGYVSGGYFDGGGFSPVMWNDVDAYVPAVERTVVVKRVTVVGHDDNAPSGQQDTMMLNDTTLAHGQVQQGADGGTVNIAATQSTPGVGPWDNGGSIVNTALQASPQRPGISWLVWVLGVALAVMVLAGVTTWVIIKRRRGAIAAR
jgi:hypothetical protein